MKLLQMLYLMYQQAEAAEKKNEEIIEEEPQEKKIATANTLKSENLETVHVDIKKTEAFGENSKTVDYYINEVWNKFKIEIQFELWSGHKFSHSIPDDLRNYIWNCLKFRKSSFKKYLTEKSHNKSDELTNAELEEIWLKYESNDPLLKGSKSPIDRITSKHVEMMQDLLRGPKNNDLAVELRRFNNPYDKIKYLKGVCNDPKIMLWLLTHPSQKIKMALRMQNNIQSIFTMMLLLEEIHTNSIVVMKLEKDMNEEFKSKIYMHFFLFANFESLMHIHQRQKAEDMADKEQDMFEYIKFLEDQLASSQQLKAQYLEEVTKMIEDEPKYDEEVEYPGKNDFNSKKGNNLNLAGGDFDFPPKRPDSDDEETNEINPFKNITIRKKND